jgi:cytochrome c
MIASQIRQTVLLVGAGLVMVLTTGAVQASEALAAKYACVACHQAERKLVGPAWNDIASKYANGSKTPDQLAEAIRQGGSGIWGPVPMPAQPRVSEAEAQALAAWVLGHKR